MLQTGEQKKMLRCLIWGFDMGKIEQCVLASIEEVVMICRHLVDNPSEVAVDMKCEGYTVLVALRTNPRDVGQVIGRNAHLINSIRSFLAAIAGKNNVQIVLDYTTEEDNLRSKSKSRYNK